MSAPQTEVLITVEDVEHARHVLTLDDYVIGRNPDFHLRVDADLVSRQHAKLITSTTTTRSLSISAAATALS